ncbi:hypothetical protein PSTG_19504, partial [Puccinia striiformis f. sp. tritici PST-78]
MKFMSPSKELLEKHYADLSARPFFPGLVDYMSSGPVFPMLWEGLNVVNTGRQMLGVPNPADSLSVTICGDFCIQVGRNIIHSQTLLNQQTRKLLCDLLRKSLSPGHQHPPAGFMNKNFNNSK